MDFKDGFQISGIGVAVLITYVPTRGEVQRVKRDLGAIEKSQIGSEILGYLTDHPHSGDTLEGIAQWWLLERKIKHQIGKVKEALAELVSKELVLEYKGSDARTHYRINQSKYKEIQAFLKQRSDDMGCGGSKSSKGRAGS